MESMDQLLEEWHETKSVSVASEICERLWRAGHEEDGDGERTESKA